MVLPRPGSRDTASTSGRAPPAWRTSAWPGPPPPGWRGRCWWWSSCTRSSWWQGRWRGYRGPPAGEIIWSDLKSIWFVCWRTEQCTLTLSKQESCVWIFITISFVFSSDITWGSASEKNLISKRTFSSSVVLVCYPYMKERGTRVEYSRCWSPRWSLM